MKNKHCYFLLVLLAFAFFVFCMAFAGCEESNIISQHAFDDIYTQCNPEVDIDIQGGEYALSTRVDKECADNILFREKVSFLELYDNFDEYVGETVEVNAFVWFVNQTGTGMTITNNGDPKALDPVITVRAKDNDVSFLEGYHDLFPQQLKMVLLIQSPRGNGGIKPSILLSRPTEI